jgi:hypothetical protein
MVIYVDRLRICYRFELFRFLTSGSGAPRCGNRGISESIVAWTKLAMTDPEKRTENRRPAIAGLIIAIVLLVVGLWLAHELTAASKLQDCLMSGRTNCAVIPAQ